MNRCVLQGLRLIFVIGGITAFASSGQEVKTPQLPAPPPMRAISQDEHNQIREAKDPKARIKRTAELADLHLQHAEAFASQQNYDTALSELGNYLALIDDGFKFLANLNSDRGRIRDLYKHLELTLRAHGPRLTVMRRATPLEYALRMKEVEDFARDERTEALNAFYGHTVVRDGRQKKLDGENKANTPNKPER